MTNAYQPLQGLPGFGGGTPQPLQGMPGFAPPAPVAPQAVAQPGGSVALPPALQGASLASFDAARSAQPTQPGMLETAATQTGRGILDAVLGSGALLGAGLEGAGRATDWNGLKDFGRDLGRSSSGAAAAEAAAFLFGGGGAKGVSYAEQTEHRIAEQEKAWPMLSTVSRIGGAAAFTLATGGLSGAAGGIGATARGVFGMGAIEGAAAGAQQAYYDNAAYKDVVLSTLIGSVIGGGSAGAVHYGANAASRKLGELGSQVFGSVKTAADDAVSALRRSGATEAADATEGLLSHRATILRAVESAGENPGLKREAYKKAVELAGDKLGVNAEMDVSKWVTAKVNPIQKLLNRGELLDRVSTDLADEVARATSGRPSIDFALKVPPKLLADADKTAAIGGLQSRLTQALEQSPDARLRSLLLPASERLAKANAAESMAVGHDLVKLLSAVAKASDVGQVTAAYAKRQASALADELGSDAWGAAGKAYKTLTRLDSPLDGLDAKAIREMLREAGSERALPKLFSEQTTQTAEAYAARKMLGGDGMDTGAMAALRDGVKRANKAHELMTFDGAPVDVVMGALSSAGKQAMVKGAKGLGAMAIGGLVGGAPGMLIARTMMPVLEKVADVAFVNLSSSGAAKAAGRVAARAGRIAHSAMHEGLRGAGIWQQFTYHEQLDKLAKLVTGTSPELAEHQQQNLEGLPPVLQAQAGADMQEKLSQLMTDIPKPTPNIRGKAWESLSSGDMRKAQAMYEATVNPMSVFDDFAAGSIDYDKIRYAWKQYPGLQQASQAGLMDIIHAQLGDEQRAAISDGMLTQLDNLFGFDGALQPTLDHGFSARMSQLMQPEQSNPKPQSNGPLKLPGSKPSFTERIAGATS